MSGLSLGFEEALCCLWEQGLCVVFQTVRAYQPTLEMNGCVDGILHWLGLDLVSLVYICKPAPNVLE